LVVRFSLCEPTLAPHLRDATTGRRLPKDLHSSKRALLRCRKLR
jgi:hypothetical protein